MRNQFRAAALAGVVALTLSGVGAARQDGPKKADDPAPKLDPKDVLVGPPPELAALREAVEAAARRGENVDDVRAKLADLEKALAGKAWTRPKAAPDPAPEVKPGRAIPAPPAAPPVLIRPGRPVPPAPPLLQPDLDGLKLPGIQADLDALLKGQAMLLEAAQLLADDPVGNRDRAAALRRQAEAMMAKGLAGKNGDGLALPLFPDLALPGVEGKGRLGVQIEKVPVGVAEAIDLKPGRGVQVAAVVPGSAAEKAGVKANDVIVEFGGQPVTDDPAAFVEQVQRAKAGKYDLGVLRRGKEVTVRGVELGDAARPGADAVPLVRGVRPDGGRASGGVGVQIDNGTVTITGEQDGLKIRVTGTAAENGVNPSRIVVTDGDRTAESDTVDGLPEAYRDRVRALLGRVRIGGGR